MWEIPEFQAKRILDALTASHPHAVEVQILDRRFKECTFMQKLASDRTPRMLAQWDELQQALITTKDYWEDFPFELKSKLAYAFLIQKMEGISKIQVKDESDRPQINKQVEEFVDTVLPHLGNVCWSPVESSYAGLCASSLTTLKGQVTEMAEGRLDAESDAIECAARDCAQILQAGQSQQGKE